jgi:uncharacterized membrane protein YfcA
MLTIFDSWPAYLLGCGILAMAQMVYVLFGFGAGLIAVGGLALLLPEMQDIVVLLLLVSVPAEVLIVRSARQRVEWGEVALLLGGVALGVPLGAYALSVGDSAFGLRLLGRFLVLVAAALLLIPQGRAWRWPRWTVPPVGMLTGILSGLFGTAGPPLIIYQQLSGRDKQAFRANLMTIFLGISLVRIPLYAVLGLLTPARLGTAVAVAPAVALGGWIGHRLHIEVPERTFRRAVCVLLLILGAVLASR